MKDAAWPRSVLDAFVLAGLEAKGLAPVPEASRRAWIRRVTLDLTGLPPAPEDVAGFLADASPDAVEKAADRLLASPRHGERWGRHWLDVARYADSNGMDENLAHANAFRYRDYMIAAFNRDRPFDELIIEQLAGDLLDPEGPEEEVNERLIATGFLSLGPKMLAEDDPVKMEMDIVDEQVDTVGRVFLGLTLGCARCHAHKFDPIPTEDYYSLAGIFKSTRTMDNFKVVARWHERPLGSREARERKEAIEREIAARKAEAGKRGQAALEALIAGARSRAADYIAVAPDLTRRHSLLAGLTPAAAAGKQPAPGTIAIEAESFSRGNVIRDHTTYGNPVGVIYSKGEIPNFAEYDVTTTGGGLYQLDARYAAAEARPSKLFVNGELARAGAAGGTTGSWTPESQTWEVLGMARLHDGPNVVRLERDGPFPHFDRLHLSPCTAGTGGDLAVWKEPRDLAAARGLHPGVVEIWSERLEKAKGEPTDAAARFEGLLADPTGPFGAPDRALSLLPREIAMELKTLHDEVGALEKSLPALPEAMAVAEGKPENLRVHVRGSHLDLGPEAPRRFPRALTQAGMKQPGASGSGRLELARWIASGDNPLTARVIVNRVWRWHFGAGLVRTPDNFGRLGEPPTHTGLLDWLALGFVEEGWSLKRLHRRLVLSATYRRSSVHEARAAEIDPENRLLWRFARRRLEAEAIRDSLLAVGGLLDLSMGGTLLSTRNREYVASTASTNATRYDSPRRAVYLPVVRSALHEMFQAFDFADPSTPNGDRQTTAVAPQALFHLNAELVAGAAAGFADRLLGRTDLDDAGCARLAYEAALARPAEDEEVSAALSFLERYTTVLDRDTEAAKRRGLAWSALAKALLSSNEFVHVD